MHLRRLQLLFSSNIFLFVFLPGVILIYYTILKWSRPLQNIFLLAASLFFYAWGEPKFVLVMMLSIIINWAAGMVISAFEKQDNKTGEKAALSAAIFFNLLIIFIFKYLGFTVSNIDSLFGADIKVPDIEHLWVLLNPALSIDKQKPLKLTGVLYEYAHKNVRNIGMRVVGINQ